MSDIAGMYGSIKDHPLPLTRTCVKFCEGDLIAAVMLTEVMVRGKDPRHAIERHGSWWVIVTYREWREAWGIEEQTARRRLHKLARLGLIEKRVLRTEDGSTALHLRVGPEVAA